MTSIALPAGYDPGRLPGYLMGGDYWLNWYDGGQPAGVPSSCGAAQCPPESARGHPSRDRCRRGAAGRVAGDPRRRRGGPGRCWGSPRGGRDAAGEHVNRRLHGARRSGAQLDCNLWSACLAILRLAMDTIVVAPVEGGGCRWSSDRGLSIGKKLTTVGWARRGYAEPLWTRGNSMHLIGRDT